MDVVVVIWPGFVFPEIALPYSFSVISVTLLVSTWYKLFFLGTYNV